MNNNFNQNRKRICIVGGGFGGLYTALRLHEFVWENIDKPEIILVDKSDRFLFSPFLYELVTDEMQTWEIAPPFTEILSGGSVSFCQDTVTDIDLEKKQVELNNHAPLTYDKLVIATGGKTPLNTVLGAQEYAIPFHSIEDAYRLREKLKTLESSHPDKIRIAVVGGSYSGVEIACKLADRLGEKGRIRIIERSDTILKRASEYNREIAKQILESHKIWLDLETEVSQVEADTISLLYKGKIDTIPVDIVIWAIGNKASELTAKLPLKKNQQGLLTVNSMLQTLEQPDIFALGDMADCKDATGQQIPATAQAAYQQADFCAWNIWASLTEKPLLPFRYQPLGEMMTLGIDNATLSSFGIQLEGLPAHIARRLVYLYRLPTLKHQLTVAFNWITQPISELFFES